MKAKNVLIHLGILCSALLLFFSESGCALSHPASCRDGSSDRAYCYRPDVPDATQAEVASDGSDTADVADATEVGTDVDGENVDVAEESIEDTSPEIGSDVIDVVDIADVPVVDAPDVRDVIAEDATVRDVIDVIDVPVPTDVPPDRVSPDVGADVPIILDAGGPNLELTLMDDPGARGPITGLIIQVLPPGVDPAMTSLDDPTYPMVVASCVTPIVPGTTVSCLLRNPVAPGSWVYVNPFYSMAGTFPSGPDDMFCQTRGSFSPRCPRLPMNIRVTYMGVLVPRTLEYPLGSGNYAPWAGSLQYLPFRL